MLDKLNITYLFYVPYLLSAILSLRSFWLGWPKHLKIFSIYLLVTLVIEILGVYWKWIIYQLFGLTEKNNIHIMNLGMIIGRGILLWYFYQLLHSARIKKMIVRVTPIYVVFSVVNYFLIQHPFDVNTYSVTMGNVLVISLCIAYFAELLKADEIQPLRKMPEFWIATGTFMYFLVSLPFIISFDLVARNEKFTYIRDIFMSINDWLQIFTFTLYLIAYLCRPHPKSLYKRSLSPQ